MLRKYLLVVVMAMVFATAAARGQAPSAALTLQGAVGLALEHSVRVRETRDGIEQAKLGLRLAESDFRPKITPNVLGSFGQTDVSNQSYGLEMSQRLATGTAFRATLGAVTARNQLGNFYSTDTTFLISQPLFRGFGSGATLRNVRAAESRVTESLREQTIAEQRLAVEVTAAYYAIVTQQQLVDVSERTLERSQKLLDASAAKLAVGRVSQLDVFRAEQLVAQAESQLLDARGGVEDAKDRLRELVGRGPDFDFVVRTDVPDIPDIPIKADTISTDAAVEQALKHRLELHTAREAVAEADRTVQFSRNQQLPQLDVNLALTRRETAPSLGSSFGLDRFRVATFFGVSMPLERTQQSVAVQSAMMDRDRRQRTLDTLRLQIANDARRAVRQRERLERTLRLAGQSVDSAEKEVEVARARFDRGLSNNLDLVNAEASLLNARTRRLGILAELAVARVNLRAAIGTLDPRQDIR